MHPASAVNAKKMPTVFPIGPHWFSLFSPFSRTGIHSISSGESYLEQIDNPSNEKIYENINGICSPVYNLATSSVAAVIVNLDVNSNVEFVSW